jgi:DNA (cytosine-5)-methyltransferase 1
MKFGSLFSGIGGMDLGLERAGMQCQWQVEIDEFANRVLQKHWPSVPRFRDVRECGAHNLTPVDLITGGFPCQDVSIAGRRAGLAGTRSGLWAEFARIIGELRPRYILVENVTGLLVGGMGRVLGDLSERGYDAEWETLQAPTSALHLRKRVFIFAYPTGERPVCNEVFKGEHTKGHTSWEANSPTVHLEAIGRTYPAIPSHLRMVDGLSTGLDGIKGLGNAVVPQVAQSIGERIICANKNSNL